jgi:hypothetical protein
LLHGLGSAALWRHDRSDHVKTVLAQFGSIAERDIVYLSGNLDMVDAASATLQECGLSAMQTLRDRYISSG